MSQSSITMRYAQALFDLAEKENSVHPVYVSLQEMNALTHKEEFRIFIHNPLLSVEERSKIIDNVFKSNVPALVYKFLLFLNFKGRINLLSGIFESFDELFLAKNNQMRVELQTPYALKDDQKQSIEEKLKQKYHKEILLESQEKPELLGGFRLLAAGTLFDGTIKNQLEQFRQKVLV
jgi:F-type H+-transporting ATPase subunit delta